MRFKTFKDRLSGFTMELFSDSNLCQCFCCTRICFSQIAIDPLLNDLKSVKEPVAKLVPQTVNFFTNIRVQLGFVAEAAARDARGAD